MTVTTRASFEKLREFANKVREAGGGNPLDALMPAVPQDPSQCLIARNLNFNCEVAGANIDIDHNHTVLRGNWKYHTEDNWGMYLEEGEIATKIASALDLPLVEQKYGGFIVQLPQNIGRVAADFDLAMDALDRLNEFGPDKLSYEDRKLIEDMAPYIEASIREANNLATYTNEDGSIVV